MTALSCIPTFIFLFEGNVWCGLVQPNAKSFQLMLYKVLVFQRLKYIQHYVDQTAGSGNCKESTKYMMRKQILAYLFIRFWGLWNSKEAISN